ncbi:hypothetical protein [Pseudoduganella armeniaca]|uniref:hypothetical protein n=1 Tax=Pseudoduganella armeniaca TaxID=2072590 RepID=UPI001E37EB79|nr:hypothetical protein [Pseudoduganella armeniaca]
MKTSNMIRSAEQHGAAGAPLLEKTLLSLLSPGGRRGLSILIYHRVLPRKDPLFPVRSTVPNSPIRWPRWRHASTCCRCSMP